MSAPTPAPGAVLGFGCASLFGLPTTRERRSVLHAAYELGIRHFDTAPMYGLGLSESELGDALGVRDDLIVATKFGIGMTMRGKAIGRVQGPIRRALRRSGSAQSKVKQSGVRHDAGLVGRMLYRDHDYSIATARRSLAASQRALRRDRIEYFFLHEPVVGLGPEHAATVEFLTELEDQGRIGRWGPAGDLSVMGTELADVAKRASAAQFPYNAIDGFGGPAPTTTRPSITFGILASVLPRLRETLERDPKLAIECADLLDADVTSTPTLVHLLVRDAVARNPGGTVLLSSTNPRNLTALCEAAGQALPGESEVADRLRQACASAGAA